MTTNQPTSIDLLEAVCGFMEKKVMPKLDKHTAYHTRVAVNVLNIIGRELAMGPKLDAAEQERLKKLLNSEGDLESLNRELCRQIQEGTLDWHYQELCDHLRQTAMGKLTIDNPDYSACRQ